MTAPAPKLTHLPDVLAEHLDELGFLWSLRERALGSPDYTMRELGLLEERVEARLQGVLAYGEHAWRLCAARLADADGDPDAAFAAALALLHGGAPDGASRALDAFGDAEGERLDALRRALCAAPPGTLAALAAPLQRLLGARPALAAAAAEVLAVGLGAAPPAGLVEYLARDDAPAVRAGAWRTVATLGLAVDARTLAAGARDEDPAVRRAALEAAAWAGNPGVLALGRRAAEARDLAQLDAIRLLAVLGGPEELARLGPLVEDAASGPARFALAAAFGHPALVPVLLDAMAGDDPEAAAAAGDAFARLSGAEVGSGARAPVGGGEDAGGDAAFAAAFRDDVELPDAARAHAHWRDAGPALAGATRLASGLDVARPLAPDDFARLDLRARHDLFLRARFHGSWSGSPAALAAYPQVR